MTATMSKTAPTEIPVIDIGRFRDGSPEDRRLVAAEIGEANETVGFIYIANHGVPQDVIDAAFEASARFFALPEEEKLKVRVNFSHRGYIPMNNATYKEGLRPNVNESWLAGTHWPMDSQVVKDGTPLHGPNQWPDLEGFREPVERYFEAVKQVGFDLLRAFALALDLEEDFFVRRYETPMPFIRLLHYPQVPGPKIDNQFGAAAHTDYGCLTILAQDSVSGLQVKPRSGDWIDAVTKPGTFVVNIGDMLMRWTNDRWVSNPHRVISNGDRDRYSIPVFFDPTYQTLVECIESCAGPDNPPKYEPIVWGDYLKQRFDSIYAYRKKQDA